MATLRQKRHHGLVVPGMGVLVVIRWGYVEHAQIALIVTGMQNIRK